MQSQDQNAKRDGRLQTFRILWFALVMSVVLYFVMTLLTGQLNNAQPNAVLSLGLLAAGMVLVIVSVVLKWQYQNRAVEQQNISVLQQGFIVAMVFCEVPALFGLLDHYITGNLYYYAGFIVAVCGQLYHFPRRQQLLDVTFRLSKTTTVPAYQEPVKSPDQSRPPLPPQF